MPPSSQKRGAVGLGRRYSNFLDDSETIDILLELGRYIKELSRGPG